MTAKKIRRYAEGTDVAAAKRNDAPPSLSEAVMKKTQTFQVPVVAEVIAETPEQAAYKINSVMNGAVRYSEFMVGTTPYITDFLLDVESIEAGHKPLDEWFDPDAIFERRAGPAKVLSWVVSAWTGALVTSIIIWWVRG